MVGAAGLEPAASCVWSWVSTLRYWFYWPLEPPWKPFAALPAAYRSAIAAWIFQGWH